MEGALDDDQAKAMQQKLSKAQLDNEFLALMLHSNIDQPLNGNKGGPPGQDLINEKGMSPLK